MVPKRPDLFPLGDNSPLEFWEVRECSFEVRLLTLRLGGLSWWREGRSLWPDWMDRLAACLLRVLAQGRVLNFERPGLLLRP